MKQTPDTVIGPRMLAGKHGPDYLSHERVSVDQVGLGTCVDCNAKGRPISIDAGLAVPACAGAKPIGKVRR